MHKIRGTSTENVKDLLKTGEWPNKKKASIIQNHAPNTPLVFGKLKNQKTQQK